MFDLKLQQFRHAPFEITEGSITQCYGKTLPQDGRKQETGNRKQETGNRKQENLHPSGHSKSNSQTGRITFFGYPAS
jgi:hypothetical protein